MKRYKIAPDEYIHVYNRGALKQPIFFNDRDKKRFLFLILLLQSPIELRNTDRMFKEFIQNPESYIHNQSINLKDRYVELTAFCLMQNHFHLLVHEIKEGGIAKYMQRVQNAYTKYINIKYQKSGHLFQGAYKDVLVESNEQLLHVSAYIHKNPKEITEWQNNYLDFPWSSCKDFIGDNQWGDFLRHEIVTSQFSGKGDDTYKNFIQTSLAKENDLKYQIVRHPM